MDKLEATKLLEKLQRSPVAFAEEKFGDKLEEYQKNKILKPIVEHDRVSIKACHAVGKTWSLSRAVLWFSSVFPDSIVITTAPTDRQVRLLLWSEIRAAYKKAKERGRDLGGEMLQKEWKIDEKWYAIGFSPKVGTDSGSGQGSDSSFQGFHAKYILIVFDEAVGISPQIWKMVEGLLTSGKIVKFVCIANPTSKSCKFFETFSSFQWHNETINCFDSPNLIANNITNKKELIKEVKRLKKLPKEKILKEIQAYKKPNDFLITAQWVVSMTLEHGIDHPLVKTKALGEFPDEDENTLIPLSVLEEAISRELEETSDELFIGIDPARFGPDSTVLTAIIGNQVFMRREYTGKTDGPKVAAYFKKMVDDIGLPCKCVVIDQTGIGSSPLDQIKIMKKEGTIDKKTKIVGVHFGQGPEQNINPKNKDEITKVKKQYANLKARMFDQLSKDVKEELSFNVENSQLTEKDIKQYLKEMPLMIYEFTTLGKRKMEGKKEFKARTQMGSPDSSDSVALANWARHQKAGLLNLGAFIASKSGFTDSI